VYMIIEFISYYRTGAVAVAGLGLITISLFSYVLFLPWFTGEEPNVRTFVFSTSMGL